jgi:hypothetical protein
MTNRNEYLAKWREKNREKIRQQHKDWYERHKTEEKFRTDRAKFFKEWHGRNLEHRKIYLRDLRRNNPERYQAYKKKWSKENPEKYRAMRKRELENPSARIASYMRTRIRLALLAQRVWKRGKTLELLGCSIPELRKHLEDRFLGDMNWENYGQWHIDHIRPISSFNLMEADQQKIAFHYSNLQPLWAVDNLKKGKRHDTQAG